MNKSRKSPSLSFCSSLDKYSFSSGISLPFSLAILLRVSLASITRPFFSNQRTDSGMKLWNSHKQTKQDQYPQRARCNFSTPDILRSLRTSRSTFSFCLDSLEKTGLPCTEHVPIGTAPHRWCAAEVDSNTDQAFFFFRRCSLSCVNNFGDHSCQS